MSGRGAAAVPKDDIGGELSHSLGRLLTCTWQFERRSRYYPIHRIGRAESMRKRIVLLARCTGIAIVVASGVSQAQTDGINLAEFRNWLSASARYQALGELCTGRSHDQVRSEINRHIDRLFPSQAGSLKQHYDQRYARFQRIARCPQRDFSSLQELYETRQVQLATMTPAQAPAGTPVTPTQPPTTIRTQPGNGDTDSAAGRRAQRTPGRQDRPAPDVIPAASAGGNAEELYARGIASFLSPRQSTGFFSQAIAVDPDSVRNYRARAWANLSNNDPAAALADFEQVLAMDPNDREAYRGRGWARLHLGQYQPARSDFSESVRRARNPAESYAGRALANYFLGDMTAARADFRASMRYQPDFNDAEIYSRAGELLATPAEMARDPESFSPRARAARRKDPRFNGDVSTHLDDWARFRKVESQIRNQLNTNPRNADAWLALAVTSYRQLDDDPGLSVAGTAWREARSAFNRAVDADPRSVDIRVARALFAATPGVGSDPDMAIADLTAAIELDPQDGEAYVRRALVRAVDTVPSSLALAIDDCDTASSLRPNDVAVPELCEFLRDRRAQATLAQRQRQAYEQKVAEFEDVGWLFIGVILWGVYSANSEDLSVCFDEEVYPKPNYCIPYM